MKITPIPTTSDTVTLRGLGGRPLTDLEVEVRRDNPEIEHDQVSQLALARALTLLDERTLYGQAPKTHAGRYNYVVETTNHILDTQERELERAVQLDGGKSEAPMNHTIDPTYEGRLKFDPDPKNWAKVMPKSEEQIGRHFAQPPAAAMAYARSLPRDDKPQTANSLRYDAYTTEEPPKKPDTLPGSGRYHGVEQKDSARMIPAQYYNPADEPEVIPYESRLKFAEKKFDDGWKGQK
jgi:hypothetical protein